MVVGMAVGILEGGAVGMAVGGEAAVQIKEAPLPEEVYPEEHEHVEAPVPLVEKAGHAVIVVSPRQNEPTSTSRHIHQTSRHIHPSNRHAFGGTKGCALPDVHE